MKRIVINCRILNKRHGGPRRFLLNLLLNLAKTDSVNEYILVLDQRLSAEIELPRNFTFIVLGVKSRILYEYFSLPFFVNRTCPDIFIVPDPCYSPLIRSKKICIYHDVIYFERDQEREFKYFDNLHHKVMIPICGKRSDLNICVSHFTQDRAIKLLGLKNTRVFYEAVDDSIALGASGNRVMEDDPLLKYGIKAPYIFYMGSLSPRKNMQRTIEAFLSIKDKIPHNFYLVGGYSWNDEHIQRAILENGGDGRLKKIGFVEDVDLVALYGRADVFLYPSLYEGFGLPILEAQSSGCAVITSGIGATQEIAGKGAYLVDPYDQRSIQDGIITLTEDRKLRDDLIALGRENIGRFSWMKFAEELVGSYKDI